MKHAFMENYAKYMGVFHETLINGHLRHTKSQTSLDPGLSVTWFATSNFIASACHSVASQR